MQRLGQAPHWRGVVLLRHCEGGARDAAVAAQLFDGESGQVEVPVAFAPHDSRLSIVSPGLSC